MEKRRKTSYSVPAVDRMLDIIEFLVADGKSAGITELSRALGINTNSVFRIVRRLVDRGYLEAEGDSGKYRLGTKLFTVGMSLYTSFELRKRARRQLEWLSRETGETTQVQVPDGDRMLVLDTVVPPVGFFLQVVPGARVYYHNNAFGKAVLAFREAPEIRRLLPRRLPSLTSNTITDVKTFLAQLAHVRRTGVAYDVEEYIQGVFCIGAPVFDCEGQAIAGLGVTGLVSRYREVERGHVIQAVLAAASKVSLEGGYDGSYYADLRR